MPGAVGALTVALWLRLLPAPIDAVAMLARLVPAELLFEVVMRTTVFDAAAAAVPVLANVQLTLTLLPALTLLGLKPML